MTPEQIALAERIYASMVTSAQLRNVDWVRPPAAARETLANLAHFAEVAAKIFHEHLEEEGNAPRV